MPEKPLSQPAEMLVTMPRRYRIKQRLGQISTGRRFNQQVIPPIAGLERKRLPAHELITHAVTVLTEYSGSPAPDGTFVITDYLQAAMPKILSALTDSRPREHQAVMQAWQEMAGTSGPEIPA